ncbi:MAG: hypothetical protein J0L92_30535, partial [Deltaproteobacteria bacterium]|nr:hypothetical protein [Deltaproteobacteria bacterium]
MNEASAIERRCGTAAVVTLVSLLMGCGGATAVGAPATESQPLARGPELPDRVQRQHRRRMEECLALAAAPVTAPSLDYPDYLLDGLDLERAPRPAAQLEREIAHTSTLLSRAGDDREEREGALVALARFERELSRHREGEEALTLRRQELEHLEAFVSAFPESSLVAFAQLSMGRAKLALGDTEGAVAAFRATLAVPRVELHL